MPSPVGKSSRTSSPVQSTQATDESKTAKIHEQVSSPSKRRAEAMSQSDLSPLSQSSKRIKGETSIKSYPDNPSLKKLKIGGEQAYEIDGVKLARTHSMKTDQLQQLGKVGTSGHSNVFSRRNPESPFLRKKTDANTFLTSMSSSEIEKLRKTTNDIAKLVTQDDLLSKHVVVEVLTAKKEHHLAFITPRVDGHTLRQWIDNPHKYPTLTKSEVVAKLAELRPVIAKLGEYGIVHNDLHPKNIMYDQKEKKFVLIDFGTADKIEGNDKLLDTFKKIDSACLEDAITQANGAPS
jgi:tRNA A-37 threonylcarbamoyl transferase component Bud32